MEKKPTMPVVHAPVPTAIQPVAMAPMAPKAHTKALSKHECLSLMHRYVEVQAVDGYCYDGIVEHVDDQWLCLAVPGAVDPMRGFFPSPFYPFSPFRPRRFNRLVLPLAGLLALSLLPYY